MTTSLSNLRESMIDVTGGRIHYVEKGAGDPLVLVHGFAPISTWHVWEANIEALAEKRRVVAVDLPGYGDSVIDGGEAPKDFTHWFSTYAQAVHDLITSLDVGPVALGGLSAGGGASLFLTSQWPDDVEKLILVDSAGSQDAARWKSIERPTLIVWQQEDELLNVEEGRKLHEAIPNSRLEILEGNSAGIEPYQWHWAQALNPQKFNELVLDFLR